MVSEAFKIAVLRKRLDGVRMYRLATRAKVSGAFLSGVLHDAQPVKRGDPRVIRVGQLLGLDPDECFAPDIQRQTADGKWVS